MRVRGERNAREGEPGAHAESGRFAGREEQPGKLAELSLAEMAELAAVEFADGRAEAREQREARSCNTNKDFAAIGIFTAAADETSFFEAVEKAGDVGVAGDHAAGDLATEQAFVGAAQDAQDVVLIRGEVVFFEEQGGAAGEQVSGAHEFDENGFLRAGNGWAGASGNAGHTYKMVVGTDKCQRAAGSR